MAEAQLAVASAVILPDAIDEPQPSAQGKRRQSTTSVGSAKRPRLTQHSPIDTGKDPIPTQGRVPERRRNGQLEERKRGQRLFGALLDTLSQSSSSTAQKRRTDIEKKQQAKLKLQAEEYDEKKKQRLDALMAIRRIEQKKFDNQSMRIRHSNLLAGAHFLQTQAEPKLVRSSKPLQILQAKFGAQYYKPWEFMPGDEDRIQKQIEEAERTVEREAAEFEVENPGISEDPAMNAHDNTIEKPDDAAASSPTVGLANALKESSTCTTNGDTNPKINPTSDLAAKAVEPPDVCKDNGNDAGDILVEGEEDTVIY